MKGSPSTLPSTPITCSSAPGVGFEPAYGKRRASHEFILDLRREAKEPGRQRHGCRQAAAGLWLSRPHHLFPCWSRSACSSSRRKPRPRRNWIVSSPPWPRSGPRRKPIRNWSRVPSYLAGPAAGRCPRRPGARPRPGARQKARARVQARTRAQVLACAVFGLGFRYRLGRGEGRCLRRGGFGPGQRWVLGSRAEPLPWLTRMPELAAPGFVVGALFPGGFPRRLPARGGLPPGGLGPAGVLLPLGLWLGESPVERALLVGSLLQVPIVELFNSAIETNVDRVGLGAMNSLWARQGHRLGGGVPGHRLAASVWALVLVPKWI